MLTSWCILNLCFLLLTSTSVVNGYIPRVCAHNLTNSPAICCPIPAGEKLPCGFPSRGACRPFQVYQSRKLKDFAWIYKNDLRVAWPKRVFQYGCECFGQYGSYHCGECRFGYEGSRCQHRVQLIRHNIKTYTPLMKQRFQNIIMKTRVMLSDYVVPMDMESYLKTPYKTITIQEELAAIHWLASYGAMTKSKNICDKFNKHVNYNHDGTGFIAWHRYFLLLWEKRTRTIARQLYGWQNFTFPYWDWTDAKKCEVCTNDLVCETTNIRSPGGGFYLSPKCPFHNWQVICTDVDVNNCVPCYLSNSTEYINREFITQNYPTTDEVKTALTLPIFYNAQQKCSGFSEYFEGGIGGCGCAYRIHNQVHMNILGPFNRSRTAANDPLFIFHHSQLDRLFQRWMVTVGPSKNDIPSVFTKPGHCRRCPLIGFYPPVKNEDMFVDIRSLGIDYDNYDFGQLKASTTPKMIASMNEFKHTDCKEVNAFTKSKVHYHMKLN